MKNKNLLAENMLRFKAKNLSETAKQNIVELARIIKEAEATGDPAAPVELSGAYSPGDVISRPFGNANGTSMENLQKDGVKLVSTIVKTTMPNGEPYPDDAKYIQIKLSFTDYKKNTGDVIMSFIKKPNKPATLTGMGGVQMSGPALTGNQASNLRTVIKDFVWPRKLSSLYTSNYTGDKNFWPNMYAAMDKLI